MKSQVAPWLGHDTFEAIKATDKWAADEDDARTACVSAIVIPGHAITILVYVELEWCLKFVNEMLY